MKKVDTGPGCEPRQSLAQRRGGRRAVFTDRAARGPFASAHSTTGLNVRLLHCRAMRLNTQLVMWKDEARCSVLLPDHTACSEP